MDYKSILENYKCKTCIMSVERFPDGTYGNIRVVTGNRAHIEEIERVTGHPYSDDVPYQMCFPENMNFEDFCYRCAIEHQPLHSYVEIYEMHLWLEMYLLPLNSDKDGTGYCLYSYNITPNANASIMTDVSPEVSSAVLTSCIKLHGEKNFEECISEVIGDIRDICGARRCCIILVDKEARESKVLADSLRPEYVATRTGEMMNKGFYSTVEGWEDTLAGSTSLIVKNEQDMQVIKERNPSWYESLKRNTVDTLVLFPLKYNGKLVGYIWASNFAVENAVMIKGVLELATFFIASRIANYQLVQRLEKLSTMDALTGTKNRNAMNNRVAEYDNPGFEFPKSIGVIFADLNGLKQTNDKKGHEAGDRLLKKCAAILHQAFVDEDVYRAGGDEFMIISENCTEKEIADKVLRLREICDADKEVNFAIGYSFEEGVIDIRACMSLADARMYEDKEEYYKKYPEKRYR
jgi:diguanylate cyclase (GGDEF)-like protein